MSIHIALLRAINVGGRNKVAMADLRRLLSRLGFEGAASLLQSGNLVFRSPRLTGAALETLLEKETVKRLGIRVDYIVRSGNEWRELVARNPFRRQAQSDPSRLIVMFLKSAPSRSSIRALRSLIEGGEGIRSAGKQLFVVYPTGIGRSKLTGALIERRLGTRGTARNWNTILKVEALLRAAVGDEPSL